MDPTLTSTDLSATPEIDFDEAELAALDAQFLKSMENKGHESVTSLTLTPNQWVSIGMVIAFASVFVFCVVWIMKTHKLRAQRKFLERAGFAVR